MALTDFTTEEDKLAKTATFPITDNDRPLNEEEVEAEERASYFPIAKYLRIKPLPGTLGFYLRNFRGKNDAVANFLFEVRKTNNSKWLKDFCIIWPILDDYSKKRVDVFDLFCRKWGIPISKFWGVLQESIFFHAEALTQLALSEYKPRHVELLIKMAEKPKNHQDRKVLTETLGLTKGAQFTIHETNIRNQTNNTQLNVGSNVPNFAKSIKRTEVSEPKPKEITEGKQDYVDAEFSVVETTEKEMVESKIV